MKRLTAIMILFILVLIGCEESVGPKGNYVKNLNSLTNNIKINNYFIHDNKYWEVCWDYEDKIWDKEEGFIVEGYERNPVTNIVSGHDYEHDIYKKEDGTYEMRVDLTCRYDVYVKTNVFAYHLEKLTFDGGDVYFNMNIEELEEGYRLTQMKAYKQELNGKVIK